MAKNNNVLLCKTTISVKAVKNPYDGKFYIKTHDVAKYLDIKQPFEFTSTIKKYFGDEAVLKGNEAVGLRRKKDQFRTTFILADVLYEILTNPYYNPKCNMNEEKRYRLSRELINVI